MSDVSPSMAEIAFLRRLDAGIYYNKAVLDCGDDGVKIAFNCTLKGWVDRGSITKSGLAMIMPVITINQKA